MFLAHRSSISLVLDLSFGCLGIVSRTGHSQLPGTKFTLGYLEDIMVRPFHRLVWQRAGLSVLDNVQ
jgi:hypothetical protein